MSRRDWIFCVVLALATVWVYSGVLSSGFIGLDDPRYVTENRHVRDGLDSDGVVWAFTTLHKSNWHPLAWLSHMLDVEMHGLEPGGHHATSVALHILNAILLFAVLRSATGAAGPSALVAGLFALHPTHAESVAWIAERKDVLSATFWMLTLGAWLGFARRGGAARYALVLLCLALGLMAKAMLVTLPLVLLLVDVWPLGRLGRGASVRARVLEKLPLLALALAASALALLAQERGQAVQAVVPLPERLANAVMSYGLYVWKTLWPRGLALLYPHPNLPGGQPWALWQVAVTGAGLLAATLLILRARSRPYLAVGWLWFGVSLLPVIGLVQVGKQAMADRYTYLPCIGLYVMAAWGGADLARRLTAPRRRALAVLACIWLGALAVVSARQVGYWRDSVTLFERSLAVAPGSPTLHNNLGTVLRKERLDDAIRHFRRAVEINPAKPLYHANLVDALRRRGDFHEAALHDLVRRGVPLDSVDAQLELGDARLKERDVDGACDHYERAVELDPESGRARGSLGRMLAMGGQYAAAVPHLRASLGSEADRQDALVWLGLALLRSGQAEQAISRLEAARRLDPEDPRPRQLLAEARRGAQAGSAP